MRFSEKRVLVIGGAGFIGSVLSRKLAYEEGAKVTVLDDLSYGVRQDLAGHLFVEGSITDYNLVSELVGENDVIFNLACRCIVLSTSQPRDDFEVNAEGIVNVLLAARKYAVDRVVFASSASVYGNSKYFPINESDQLYALNPYAASKIAGESYCTAFYETYCVPTTVLRYSNVYGAGQNLSNPYSGVVAKFMGSYIHGGRIKIHGDGNQTRDFTYVDDVVEATMLAAICPKAIGEALNVGTGVETSVGALAGMIGQGQAIEYVNRRDIDNVRRRVLNIEKTRRFLGWIPLVDLSTGIEKTRRWYEGEKSAD